MTAIIWVGSESKRPECVLTKQIDYNKPQTLVKALRGQDALVITMSGHPPKCTEEQLVKAAAESGVSWILPSDFTLNTANEALVKDVSFIFQPRVAIRQAIQDLGKSSYISVIIGYWFE